MLLPMLVEESRASKNCPLMVVLLASIWPAPLMYMTLVWEDRATMLQGVERLWEPKMPIHWTSSPRMKSTCRRSWALGGKG